MQRGLITYPERASQLCDHRGLVMGDISPTDIDGLIEYHNHTMVFFELKVTGTAIKTGQRLAFERVVNCCEYAGKHVILFICEHDTPIGQLIVSSETIIRSFYYKRKWKKGSGRTTLGKGVIDFIKMRIVPENLVKKSNPHQMELFE